MLKGQFTKISRYANVSGSTHVVSSHYSYDQANRLTKLVHNTSTTPPASGWGTSPVPLAGYQYTYDLANPATVGPALWRQIVA